MEKHEDIRALFIRGKVGKDFRDLMDVGQIAKRKGKNIFNVQTTNDILVLKTEPYPDLGGFTVTVACRRRPNPE